MEILNIGLGELLMIGIIALLVFGPDRLPEMARQAGRFLRQVRGFSDEIQRTLLAETQPITQSLQETRRELEATVQPVRDVQSDLRSTLQEVTASITAAPAAPPPPPTAEGSPAPVETPVLPSYKPNSRGEVPHDETG